MIVGTVLSKAGGTSLPLSGTDVLALLPPDKRLFLQQIHVWLVRYRLVHEAVARCIIAIRCIGDANAEPRS